LFLGVSEKHVDAAGLHLIEQFEGYSRCAYWDPYGGVWTVGFGQTHGAYQGFCFSGRAAAEANLKSSVESEYEWALRALDVTLNQNQWDALCSFVYNLGAGIFQGTTVGADLRARAFYAASRQMLAYDHAGGQVLPGLAVRRADEVRLFLTPVSKPKPPSHAEILAREHRELDAHYRLREQLRALLTRHECRKPPWPHPKPSTRAYKDACRTWLVQGAIENREILKFHRIGVY
jgi:GH24 family phage-related lysozyme (muramidase)